MSVLRAKDKPKRWGLEGFEPPDKAGGPDFLRGGRGVPDRQNLRPLVDALETFFGFGDSFNRRNPECFCQGRMQGDANALPAIFDAQDGRGQCAAEAQVRAAGDRKSTRLNSSHVS